MNSEMPRVPSGASGNFASTRWMLLAVRSWSPYVMKIFVPLIAIAAVGGGLVRACA